VTEGASGIRTPALTVLALFAFAANSILTRLALGQQLIDAATFASIRLVAGAVVLVALVRLQAHSWAPLSGRGVGGPLALLGYAVPFSFAYLRLGAAVGALVLFGAVQLTMIGYGIARGERPTPRAWTGLLLASAGLGALVAPSATRPDPLGFLLMTAAGMAWGIYSLVGRTTPDALAANARSFLWSSPMAVALNVALHRSVAVSGRGVALALISGAVTSGLGYAIWYRALPRLSMTQAAVAQLAVPVLAAMGAVVLLGERMSPRLLLSGAAVLGGVALVLSARARHRA
jgi:drug/metabolite transporter (DMT)-like permease